MIWTRLKRIEPVKNDWYLTKIILTVKNHFGPIEGQGIRLLQYHICCLDLPSVDEFFWRRKIQLVSYMYLLSFRILQELPKNMESQICEWEPAKRVKTAILVGKNWLTALGILDTSIWNYPYFTSAIFVRLLMSYNVFVKHVEEVF